MLKPANLNILAIGLGREMGTKLSDRVARLLLCRLLVTAGVRMSDTSVPTGTTGRLRRSVQPMLPTSTSALAITASTTSAAGGTGSLCAWSPFPRISN